MPTTLITSALSVLSVGLVGFIIFYKIIRSKKKNREDVAFSLCWLTIGFVFTFIFIRILLFFYSYFFLAKIFAYINQVLLFFIFISLGYYIFYIEIKNNILKNFLFILIIISGLFFWFYLFQDGLIGPIISDWGTEYTPSASANSFLVFAGGLSIIFLSIFFAKQVILFFRGSGFNAKRFFSFLSLLIFILAGIFEQLGNANWQVLFFRIFILISALLAFYIYLFNEEINN